MVYAFDVLMDIYQSQGYTERDAAQSILAHNLYGLDIDDRAYQLTYFALMMKARQYDRRIFIRGVRPQVFAVEESNGMEKWEGDIPQTQALDLSESYRETADYLIDTFQDAKEYGSLIMVEPKDYEGLAEEIQRLQQEGTDDLLLAGWLYTDGNRLISLARQAQLLGNRFLVSATNPPYMGSGNMNSQLAEFMKKHYPYTKGDLSTGFMERCIAFLKDDGMMAMLNIPVWMFLSSYEKMRHSIQTNNTYITMAHLGRGIFGSDFGTTSFVISKRRISNYIGVYCRLFEKQGAVDSAETKERWFLEGKNRYTTSQENFDKIPGEPIAYWVNEKLISAFNNPLIKKYADCNNGFTTGNNNLFLRLWFEVEISKIYFNCKSLKDASTSHRKWFVYNKGGQYRKWFGNNDYVLNWENDGYEIKKYGHLVPRSLEYMFRECVSWSKISSGNCSFRFKNTGTMFDVAGLSLFPKESKKLLKYLLGLCNSKLSKLFLEILSPTLNYETGQISKIPVIYNNTSEENINHIVTKNITISKADWDSFETSWDYQGHPLVKKDMSDLKNVMSKKSKGISLEDLYRDFQMACEERFIVLQENEEKLNRIFIDLYGLQDELTPEVADKDITVHKVFDQKEDAPESMAGSNYVLTKQDVMKSLLSYAVGCLFGRYSLDTPGLAYAGGEWDANKYKTFIPDDDNVVPITDEEYFDDDLPSFICAWLKKAFGRDNFEANLEFLTDVLGTKGATPKEKLRNYFLKDFYKDHCRTYQKRPIYWLFDSGKENGFKALVYIHRWNQDTEGRVLLYLHKVQRKYETELRMLEQEIATITDKHRIGQLEKRREHLEKQLAEVKAYDEKLDHMASEHLAMDLDDGVKVNYEKMQTDREGIKYPILAKVK